MWTDLKNYVLTDASRHAFADDDTYITQCWDEASALVAVTVGTSVVPDVVLHRAILEVGHALYERRAAPNGIAQFSTFDAAPVRIARDPLNAVYPILRPYLGPGIA